MWPKGVRWYHVESDILKEGPGTKTSWGWEIPERKLPSVKILFKTMIPIYFGPQQLLYPIDVAGKPTHFVRG